MAFVSEFEYDIFISYAHIDNIAFSGQANGWIEEFYKKLNLILAQRFGRMDMVKIWWDSKKLEGNTVFNHSIEQGIKNSAIIICLNSPGYIASDYCRQELETFYKKANAEKAGLTVVDRSRIIHVLLNNIPFKEWPVQLSGTSGFHFHNAEGSEEFGDAFDTNSIEFKNQMHELRDAIYHLLTDFQKQSSAIANKPEIKTIEEKIEEKHGFTIYLGEVADTLRIPRKRIVAELEKKGYHVVAGIPPPNEAAAHEEATKDALDKADLAVHLLDEYPGHEISGTPEISYPQKQTELALQTDKPQIIWMPAEIDLADIEDENYKGFLKNIGANTSTSKPYEFIRGTKATLAQEILDYAEQIKARQNLKQPSKERMSVLLDTHFNDQFYAYELGKAMLENQIQPFINPQEDDPRKNINLLEGRISQVRKLVFLYGTVSREWVFERMSAALQLIITNDYPVENFYIYMVPPKKEVTDIYIKQRFLKVDIVDSSRNQIIDKSVLKKFLFDLKAENV